MQDQKPAQETSPQESNQTPPPKSDPSKSKNVIKFVIIGCVVVAVILVLILVAVLIYLFARNRGGETSDDTAAEVSDDTEDDEDDTSDEVETLIYTNEYYPELRITYDSTWTLDESMVDNGDYLGAKNTDVTFTKSGHQILYSLSPITVFGGVPVCYRNGAMDYTHIESTWARIAQPSGYYYTNTAYIKGADLGEGVGATSFESLFDVWGGELDVDDYDFCTFDAPMSTSSTFVVPAGVYMEGENYLAFLSISIEITGTESSAIVEEIDDIVLSSEF